MAYAGPTGGPPAAHPLQKVINHRKPVATIFPRSVTAAMADAQAVTVDNHEMFHCAASQGMLSSVLALIADGRFSHDLPDRFGRTPLHWAAEQGHRNVVFHLLRLGESVDPRSQCSVTPIMLTASRGHAEVVGVLLYYRAGESDRWPSNRHRRSIGSWRSTALHCAAAGGNEAVVRRLLNAGFDKGQHDAAGVTPAEVSARQSHSASPAITRLLIPARDMGGKLVYDYVNRMVEDVATVSGLVKGGAFLDWHDGTGDTPLHRAVRSDHAAILRILLKGGADPNILGLGSASRLHFAACAGRGEIVADLLEAGADMEILTLAGYSPLHMAVGNNRVNAMSLLLNAGASIELCDGFHGRTPLSWACHRCLAPIVRVLVEAGADCESRCFAGLTPLHWACRFIDAESVEVLLNAGAGPGAVDQAAANDAVAMSSSRSGTIVSMPVAIDVLGLGYPLKEDLRLPFPGGSVPLAARRLDLVSVKRIELAL